MTYIYTPIYYNSGNNCIGEYVTKKINDTYSITYCHTTPHQDAIFGALLLLLCGGLLFGMSFAFRDSWDWKYNKGFWIMQFISYPMIIFGIWGLIAS